MNDRYGKQKKDKTGICESMGAESEKKRGTATLTSDNSKDKLLKLFGAYGKGIEK